MTDLCLHPFRIGWVRFEPIEPEKTTLAEPFVDQLQLMCRVMETGVQIDDREIGWRAKPYQSERAGLSQPPQHYPHGKGQGVPRCACFANRLREKLHGIRKDECGRKCKATFRTSRRRWQGPGRARSLSPEKRWMLASNARVFARSAYSLEAIARRELEVYVQLLRRHGHDRFQRTRTLMPGLHDQHVHFSVFNPVNDERQSMTPFHVGGVAALRAKRILMSPPPSNAKT